MMKIRYGVCAALLALSVACVREEIQSVPEETVPQTVNAEAAALPGKAVVEFDDALCALVEEALEAGTAVTKSAPLNSVLDELGLVSLERVFPDAGEYEPRTRAMGLHRFYKVRFAEDRPVTKASASLLEVPGVVSAHPAHSYRLRSFNDPYLSRQWHYSNSRTPGADINVQKVWDSYTTGDASVIVAVADEGVDYTHPDLAANMWTDAAGNHGYNFYANNSTITFGRTGDTGHGTHVAGTVAAVNNNGIGVCGVAGGDAAAGIPGVRIMSCQIFSGEYGADDASCGNAIKWGADHGAVISQNSWGDYADLNEDGVVSAAELAAFKKRTIEPEIKAAVDYFIKYAGCDNEGNQLPDSPMKGGIVFFAAGNENIDYDPICAYEPVVSVGAFGGSGAKSSYSNYGSWVDLGAPGGDGSYVIYSTLPSSRYGGSGWMGTSMACPHVSGVAALLVSYFGGPGFTNTQLREYLLEGAVEDYFSGTRAIGRKLDAFNSFVYAGAAQSDNRPPVITFSEQSGLEIRRHETVDVPFTATDPEGSAVRVSLTTPLTGVELLSTDGYRLRITAPSFAGEGTYSVTVRALDAEGAVRTATFSFVILPNHAPVLATALPDVVLRGVGETALRRLDSYFQDEDGEKPAFEAASSETGVVSVSLDEERLTVAGLATGQAEVTVTARDALGLSARGSFRVAVCDPENPVVPASTRVDRILALTNDAEALAEMQVTVYSATGAKVKEGSYFASAFEPARIGMSDYAPGVYIVRTVYNGKTYTHQIVKV